MATKAHYYIARYVNGVWEDYRDLETFFTSMRISQITGLSAKGKINNIYTESYPETEELRVYLPPTPNRANTDLEFTLTFGGETRRDVYDDFIGWVSGYKLKYYDTVRGRETEMVLIDAPTVDDDYLYGSCPFFTAKVKFKNLYGHTTKKDITL